MYKHPPVTKYDALPRLAIIGISGYGRIHLNLARDLVRRGSARIVAAVIINQQEERETVAELRKSGCLIYANDSAMWKEHAGLVDLCMIPTGIHLHARMAVAALQAGANVLVEKPLAGCSAEVRAIRAAELSSGRFVAVGFQDIYAASTNWLLDVLRSGKIGRVESVRFICIWPRPRSYFLRNAWAGRLKLNGAPVYDSPLNNACGHFVLLSLLFAECMANDGPVKMDSAELYRAHAIETFDTAVVTGSGKSGTRIWAGVSHASSSMRSPEILIEGSEGVARWHYEREAVWQNNSGSGGKITLNSQEEVRQEMMAAVMRRLANPAEEICSTALAAQHTAFIEAVHQSSQVCAFPESMIDWVSSGPEGNSVPAVRGLDGALNFAFEHGLPLSSAGFPGIILARAAGS